LDSGEVFVADESLFPIFLTGLPQLHADQRSFLEAPFSNEELAATVDKVANGKAPGLPCSAALNGMLAAGELGASLRQDVVRLLPKVVVPLTWSTSC
jgi:hypothetical protein